MVCKDLKLCESWCSEVQPSATPRPDHPTHNCRKASCAILIWLTLVTYPYSIRIPEAIRVQHAAAMAMRVLDCLLLLLALKVVHAAAPVQRSIVPDLTPVLIKQLQQANISKYYHHDAIPLWVSVCMLLISPISPAVKARHDKQL